MRRLQLLILGLRGAECVLGGPEQVLGLRASPHAEKKIHMADAHAEEGPSSAYGMAIWHGAGAYPGVLSQKPSTKNEIIRHICSFILSVETAADKTALYFAQLSKTWYSRSMLPRSK